MISARVESSRGEHRVTLSTGPSSHRIEIAPKASGFGSSANGGELLCLAVATCYCNDIYREAAKRSIDVAGVEVRVTAEFGGEGDPARSISYDVKVSARADEEAIGELIAHTDKMAEIHNTLRLGMPVTLASAKAVRLG